MGKRAGTAFTLTIIAVLVLVATGCVGPDPADQVREHFQEQGIAVKDLSINTSPHEAQIMMDRMILSSHGITDGVYDNQLTHATVTLENGEEVTAVRYKDKVYTYDDK